MNDNVEGLTGRRQMQDINYSDNFNIFKIIVESRNIANWGGTGTEKMVI